MAASRVTAGCTGEHGGYGDVRSAREAGEGDEEVSAFAARLKLRERSGGPTGPTMMSTAPDFAE